MKEGKATIFDLENLEDGDEGTVSAREEEFQREYKRSRRRAKVTVTVVSVLLAVAFIVSFAVGRYALAPGRVLGSLWEGVRHAFWSVGTWLGSRAAEPPFMTGREDTVVWLVRMPRILAGVLVGAALSASGATYQGLFRNPMVSPDILGASAGASVGACFKMAAGFCGHLLLTVLLKGKVSAVQGDRTVPPGPFPQRLRRYCLHGSKGWLRAWPLSIAENC